jgi:septum site-determining protein MinC
MSKRARARTGDGANPAVPLCSARFYAASALRPRSPIVDWLADLDAALKRSEHPFTGRPMVLDLAAVRLSPNAIMHLISSLAERRIRILGIEGIEPAAEAQAGLPPVLWEHNEKVDDLVAPAISPVGSFPQKDSPASLLVDDFVRSGQCVSCVEGDVTIVGSVGSGAEVVAGGSIHVYGTLRGRAMAGARGNLRARIFCQHLEAELLAIGSYFMTADEIHEKLPRGPVQVWLADSSLRMSAMN